jgi:FkbH-like protein
MMIEMGDHCPGKGSGGMNRQVSDHTFRCPMDLAGEPTPLKRAMVIGQCLMLGWPAALKKLVPTAECDFLLFNNAQELSPHPPRPSLEYDFQLVHVPLRSVLPDGVFFRIDYNDFAAYERLFLECEARLRRLLAFAMRWNVDHGLLTFVMNYMQPQSNPLGRLLPRYDLRNVVHFIERLNQVLAAEVSRYQAAYFFDFDQVVATYGRKFVQDDISYQSNHNSVLSDADFAYDGGRIEAAAKISETYLVKSHQMPAFGWTELLAMYRTIRQVDMVKLIVTDLDDTIWRGVAAECLDHDDEEMMSGWPRGYVEALSALKCRGMLLALLSKNDEARIVPIWKRVVGNRLPLEHFAVRKINWRPKAENFEEILRECNLLPRSVVFIDDNPVERAAIESAFPGVRTLGPNPLLWRRILLWSAETQVATITDESANRTAMVQAQVQRERQRREMSREEFLESLDIEIEMRMFSRVDHPSFPRALELINKTNQFNTSGHRWTQQECREAMASGTRFCVFEVSDRFTNYGIVGVVVLRDAQIAQFVMSCRVVGMDVEIAIISELIKIISEYSGAAVISALLAETEFNLLARDLWLRCGFARTDDDWRRASFPGVGRPSHIRNLTFDAEGKLSEPA